MTRKFILWECKNGWCVEEEKSASPLMISDNVKAYATLGKALWEIQQAVGNKDKMPNPDSA